MHQLTEEQELALKRLVDEGVFASVEEALAEIFNTDDDDVTYAHETPEFFKSLEEIAKRCRRGEGVMRFANAREAQRALFPWTLEEAD